MEGENCKPGENASLLRANHIQREQINIIFNMENR